MKKTRRKEYDTFEAGVYKKHFYGRKYEHESIHTRGDYRAIYAQDEGLMTFSP